MDGRYSGCNIVESSVVKVERKREKKRKSALSGFVIKLGIAAVAVGAIAAVHYLPALSGVRQFLHDVICYDVFGRGEFGASVFFGK